MPLRAVSWSEQGSHSEVNEDACVALPLVGFCAVADGVGGGPAGDKASRTLIDHLSELGQEFELSKKSIQDTILKANLDIINYSKKHNTRGMACTLVAAWVRKGFITCFHIGDSRIYRIRDEEIQLLTEDHVKTVIRGERKKNIVTRAVGAKKEMMVDVSEWDWRKSDTVLLASDGITDKLDAEYMLGVMLDQRLSMAEKGRQLANESGSRGCHDDKTVVIIFEK